MIVDCAHYSEGVRQHEGPLELERAVSLCKGGDEFVWLGLHEPSTAELERVGEMFGLHELALEDAHNAHQRPKLEDYDESYFIVLRTARYDDAKEEVEFGEIHLFLGDGYAIVVRHGEASGLKKARRKLEQRPELLKEGPGAVAWAVVDQVVDDYMPVVDGIENDIGEVEEDIFTGSGESTQRIYFLKREVITFHHAVGPLLVPLELLERGAVPAMGEGVRRYMRDVADHARRVNEQVNGQRELLTSVLEANLALLSVRQNEVVREISAWAAIIAVPTFIASVYGMNFEYMPELGSRIGYPLVLGIMLIAVFGLHRFFKRVNWLS
ncbi:MAG: magnesium/cobalt transporter CorA [Solirubrobacterales bacterium]